MGKNEFGKNDYRKLFSESRIPGDQNKRPGDQSKPVKDRTGIYLMVIGGLMLAVGIAMGSNKIYGSETSYEAGGAEGIAGWILTVVGIVIALGGFAITLLRKDPSVPAQMSMHPRNPAAPMPPFEATVKDRLNELKTLLEEGLINQAEYDKKRRELIDRI